MSVKPLAVKPCVASGTPDGANGATTPPVPGIKVTVPPLPSSAVPPSESSRMIWPGPVGSWTTTVAAPGVAAGTASMKVIAPVCELSPMVSVPVAPVLIWASSALLKSMPPAAPCVLPRLMGWSESDERMTTPPSVGARLGRGTR